MEEVAVRLLAEARGCGREVSRRVRNLGYVCHCVCVYDAKVEKVKKGSGDAAAVKR